MSLIKEYLFRVQEGRDHPDAALDDIARALGGEVRGRAIVAPAPGGGSMTVYVNPTSPGRFFIYDCDGPLTLARASVSKKLQGVESIPAEPAEEKTARALAIWHQGKPAGGTVVETYLRSRGITLPVPDVLRFHPALYNSESRSKWPAMLALVTNIDGAPQAIHRTWLKPSGTGKAPVEEPRASLGPIRGCAIRLAPAAEHIAVGEGIETCLSMMMTGRPTWSAINAKNLRSLALPAIIREVLLLVDNDDRGDGERACAEATRRWRQQGRRVRLCRPPAGMDFNDLLRRKKS